MNVRLQLLFVICEDTVSVMLIKICSRGLFCFGFFFFLACFGQ